MRKTSVSLLLLTGVLLALPASIRAQDWHTLSRSRAFSGERALRVDIEYGAGLLDLRAAPEGMLYRTRLRYDAESMQPDVDYDDGSLEISLEGGNIRGGNLRSGRLDLALGTQMPIDLELKFGASEATMDLGGLRLTRAKISTGASKSVLDVSRPNTEVCTSFQLEVGAAQFEAKNLGNLRAERFRFSGGVGEVVLDFSGAWEMDMAADIEMGLGSLTLRLPRGLGVRVRKAGILAGFDSQGLIKRGDVYLSENWEGAERRLTMDLDAALGSIRVVWVD